MNTQSYPENTINSRVLTTYHSIEDELSLSPNKNYLFPLQHLGVMGITGAKSLEFLQGQLTADIMVTNNQKMTPSAHCNIKGRILAFMDVLQWDGLKLLLPLDLHESTKKSLKSVALLSRVHIEDFQSIKVYGYLHQSAEDISLKNMPVLPNQLYEVTQNPSTCVVNLGEGFYIILVSDNQLGDATEEFASHNQLLGSLTWHTLRLSHHSLNIYPISSGLFLPHRLDLQNTCYLNFNKGCYKGQEIIARTHYRAVLKHELRLVTINLVDPIYSGQKVFSVQSHAEIGEVIDYSIIGPQQYLVALSVLKSVNDTKINIEDHPAEISVIWNT